MDWKLRTVADDEHIYFQRLRLWSNCGDPVQRRQIMLQVVLGHNGRIEVDLVQIPNTFAEAVIEWRSCLTETNDVTSSSRVRRHVK